MARREAESMQEPDPDVVRRAQRGDTDAFEDLVRLYLGDVHRLAVHLVRDRELAEDICQDTFVKAYRGLRKFAWRSKFSTWLFRIAHNCAVDAIRQAGRIRDVEAAQRDVRADRDPALRFAVRAAVDALPPDLRQPFVLIEIFGFTYREAGAILGLPTGTLKSRMHRTRQLLMDALTDEEDAGEV